MNEQKAALYASLMKLMQAPGGITLNRKDSLATIWDQTRDAVYAYNAKQGSHANGIRTLCMPRDLLIRLLGVVFPHTPLVPPYYEKVTVCWLFDFEIRVSETEVGAEFAAYLCAGIDGRKCLAFTNDGASEMVQYMGG